MSSNQPSIKARGKQMEVNGFAQYLQTGRINSIFIFFFFLLFFFFTKIIKISYRDVNPLPFFAIQFLIV